MDPVVILSSETVAVGPGQEERLPVRVRNPGRRVEAYVIEVLGAAAGFAEVDPRTVSVLPGRDAEISVVFRPPAGAATPTGTLPFAVRATSEVDESASAVAEGRLELSGVAGLQAWAPDATRSGRWSAKYNIEFANHGNAAVRLAVTAHDPADVLNLELSSDVVDLPPGGRSTNGLTAKARRPFLRGTNVNHTVQVACQTFAFGAERPVPGGAPPEDDPNHRTFQVTFQQKPILTKLAMLAMLLVVALIAGAAFLYLRRGEEYTLAVAAPESPTEVTAEPLGPNGVSLSWLAVPNAVGYSLTMNRTDAGVVEPLPSDRRVTHAVEDLDPTTEYCFTVVAVGPDDSEDSGPSAEACTTTGAQTGIVAPTEVTAVPEGIGQFAVGWQYPDEEREGVTFAVLVDNAPFVENVADAPTPIEIPGEAEPREVTISVQAVRDGERSPPSEAVTVTIDAVEDGTGPGTTVPTTDGGGTQPGVSTTTPPGDGGPDGSVVETTPSTTVPPGQAVLQDVTPSAAAMLGPWRPPSAGGTSLEDRQQRLAEVFEVPAGDMEVFSNRDTIVVDENGQLDAINSSAEPSEIFIYVPVASTDDAETICDREPSGCSVTTIGGAAQEAAGSRVLVLASFDADTPVTEIDSAIAAFRAQSGDHLVHVLDGALFEGFGAGQLIVYASQFDDLNEIEALCTDLALSACQNLILTPR